MTKPSDPPEPTTLFAMSQVDIALESDERFTSSEIAGARPSVDYPQLPASSPWSTPMPPEEALGESVEDLPPLGTPAEIARSIAQLEAIEPKDEKENADAVPSQPR
jgi:hypothetical protein